MTVGEKIQKYRKELAMSQEELGQKLLLSRQTISLWENDQTEMVRNKNSLDSICASLAYAMGIEPPKHAAPPNWELTNYIDKVFDGSKADRVVMYNPDAIAQWIFKNIPAFLIASGIMWR